MRLRCKRRPELHVCVMDNGSTARRTALFFHTHTSSARWVWAIHKTSERHHPPPFSGSDLTKSSGNFSCPPGLPVNSTCSMWVIMAALQLEHREFSVKALSSSGSIFAWQFGHLMAATPEAGTTSARAREAS